MKRKDDKMPATVTHAYFAMDIYNQLPIGLKKLLLDEKKRLRMFAQSMDAMYFYHIFLPYKGKRQRQFGRYFHRNNTQAFFINLVNYIKYNGYYKNKEVMAFLYGLIAHYVLDSTMHPYIIAQTGIYDKKIKETEIYKNKHDDAETLLDLMMIQKNETVSPHAFKFYDYCFDLTEFSPILNEVIDYAFQETYDVHNMHKYYYQALKDFRTFLRFFRYDRTGAKKLAYNIGELVTLKKTFLFHVISYHQPLKRVNLYRNLEHEPWQNPSKKSEESTASFDDLYEEALEKAMKIITGVNNYFQEKKKVDLKKLFPNISYVTGKNCNLKRKIK